jgi:hypothetical protein
VRVAHKTFNRRGRRGKRETLNRPDIELPAEKRDGETLFEQKAVTQIPRFRRQVALLRAAQDGERLIASAIDDLEEHGPSRLTRILGPEEQQVGGEPDFPVGVARRAIEIRDGAIGRECRIDGEVHAPDHPLVRAPVIAAAHVDADDLGGRGVRQTQQRSGDKGWT